MSAEREGPNAGIFRRLSPPRGADIPFSINGRTAHGRPGDTVLTALLDQTSTVRDFEFSDTGRAGFCLIGACQDCWVKVAGGGSVRACTTLLSEGMAFETGSAAT